MQKTTLGSVGLFCLACVGLMSCGGSSQTAPPPPPPGTITSFLYVASGGASGTVTGFGVNNVTGALTQVASRGVGANPGYIAARSDSLMIFVPGTTDGTLDALIIHSAGDLTLDGSTSGLAQPIQAKAHPNGNFVYVLQGAGAIHIYGVDNSANLTDLGSVATPASAPTRFQITRDGSLLFAAIDGGGAASGIQSYLIDATTGLLSAGPFTATPTAPKAVSVNSAGTFLLVIDGTPAQVQSFGIQSDGALTAASTAASDPKATALASSGSTVFVGNGSNGTISSFQLAGDGSLSPVAGSPFAADAGTSDIAISPDGQFLAAVNTTANTLNVFKIANGALSKVATQSVPGGPASVASAAKNH